MPVQKLDATTLQSLRCPDGKKKEVYRDTTIRCFCVEVQSSGTKTYALKYRNKYDDQCQFKISRVGDITFAEAKKKASKVLGIVSIGGDPAEQREVDRVIPTINEPPDQVPRIRTYVQA